MFGLEILDVVIGLMFVYLLLALLASALNEYISAVLNLRGRELARGLGRLLDDLDEKGAVEKALDGVGRKLTTTTASLTEQFYNHRLIRPYATRRGRFGRFLLWLRRKEEKPRLPSYIPARTFALALLDLLDVKGKDAGVDHLFTVPAGKTLAEAATDAEKAAIDAERAAEAAAKSAAESGTPQAEAAATAAANEAAEARRTATKAKLAQVLAILKQQSSLDLTEHLGILSGLPQAERLAGVLQVQVAGMLVGAQTQLQKLHEGVEIWFNNSMDRVSGAYKRNVQGWLFAIGFAIALAMNADTIQMWQTLAANDKLADAMADRAGRMLTTLEPEVDRLRPQNAGAGGEQAAGTTGQGNTQPGSAAEAQGAQQTGGGAIQTDSVLVTPPALASGGADTTRARTPADAPGRDSAVVDSIRRDSVAWARFERIRTHLDSIELRLGWTRADLRSIGVYDTAKARRDSISVVMEWINDSTKAAAARGVGTARRNAAATKPDSAAALKARSSRWWYGVWPWAPFTHPGPFWAKVLGLIFTTLAISLGAPFWFDLLNKVISIRGAGRSPEERPKAPEGGPKRREETAPK